jgi:hypothetical protein
MPLDALHRAMCIALYCRDGMVFEIVVGLATFFSHRRLLNNKLLFSFMFTIYLNRFDCTLA